MHLLCTPQFHGRHQYLTCQVPVSCKLHIFFPLFANFYYTTNTGRGQELGMENLFQVGVATCIASPPFTTQIFRHHRKIKPLRKNGYKRTGIRHKFCCLFIPVRLSRECAIFFNGFILYFIPTLLLQSLLPASVFIKRKLAFLIPKINHIPWEANFYVGSNTQFGLYLNGMPQLL